MQCRTGSAIFKCTSLCKAIKLPLWFRKNTVTTTIQKKQWQPETQHRLAVVAHSDWTTHNASIFQQDPNSSIHFSYFSRSAADTDLETFFRADSKSSMVVGMCISSREMLRISSGVRPSILRLMAIREASLQYHTTAF